jgi:hypothetical protein
MYALKQNRYFTDIFYVYMPVPRHFQMGAIPIENWILVNFLYRFNMLF